MVEIKVCVGSSCHLKGSHEVIMRFADFLTGFTPDNVEEKLVKEVYPLFNL